MDTRTEVKRQPAPDPAATEGLLGSATDGDRGQRPAPASERAVATAPADERRLSVDPLRATDRYRLVAPVLPRL